MVPWVIQVESEQIAGSYGKLSVKEIYAIHHCNYLFENKILCNIKSLCNQMLHRIAQVKPLSFGTLLVN